jgi:hypothetical protein
MGFNLWQNNNSVIITSKGCQRASNDPATRVPTSFDI